MAVAELQTGWRAESGHGGAVFESPSNLDRLADVLAPTLVVHGPGDLVLAAEHGLALVQGIPDSTWLVVDGVGHLVLPTALVALAPAIAAHVRGAG